MQKIRLIISCLAAISYSCKPTTDTKPSTTVSAKDVVSQYAEVAYQQYTTAHIDAHLMKSAIEKFVNQPSLASFNAAKESWKTARRSYSLLEGYRFYGGPVDDPSTEFESKLNAWPIDESAVDYKGNVNSGIINLPNIYPTITSELILENNTKAGETSITTGFHVIEFLLWGEDTNPSGAGLRPYTDYLTTLAGGTRPNAERRGQYLKIVTELTADYLHDVADQWAPAVADNYRAKFINSANSDASMNKILKGLGAFSKGEFGGERLATAYITKDQEDEHDCFSDFTTTEIPIWQQSIINIYYGKYKNSGGTVVDGAGIDDLLKIQNDTLSASTDKLLANTYTACLSVPDPFDNAIKTGDLKIKTVIDLARTQGDRFVTIGKKLGYNITLQE